MAAEPIEDTQEAAVSRAIERALNGHYDLNDPDVAVDPHAVYDALREQCPVTRTDAYGGYTVISRYDDVYAALQRHDVFSHEHGVAVPPMETPPLIPLEVDPPDHTKYRKILDPLFTPKKMAALGPEIVSFSNQLIDEIVAKGECEFVTEYALVLPSRVFLRLMKLPLDHLEQFLSWAYATVHLVTDGDVEAMEKRTAAGLETFTFFAEALEARREERTDDIVSYLLDAAVPGEDRNLTDLEVLSICTVLLYAGLDTVSGLLGLTMKYLAEHPDVRAELVRRLEVDGELPYTLTEELLRWGTNTQGGLYVLKDAVVNGTQYRKGERVHIVMPAASRDPLQFADGGSLDFDREDNRHLAFGAGIHRCLGSALARVEFKAALETIHRRMPNYSIPEGEVVRSHVNCVSGVDYLPLVVGTK